MKSTDFIAVQIGITKVLLSGKVTPQMLTVLFCFHSLILLIHN